MKTTIKPINLKPDEYKVIWNKRYSTNSTVFRFFLRHTGELKYWIPFKFRNRFYMTTFNRCYSVSLTNE